MLRGRTNQLTGKPWRRRAATPLSCKMMLHSCHLSPYMHFDPVLKSCQMQWKENEQLRVIYHRSKTSRLNSLRNDDLPECHANMDIGYPFILSILKTQRPPKQPIFSFLLWSQSDDPLRNALSAVNEVWTLHERTMDKKSVLHNNEQDMINRGSLQVYLNVDLFIVVLDWLLLY